MAAGKRLPYTGELIMRRLLTFALLAFLFSVPALSPARAQAQPDDFVRYAAPDGEYSLLLPEAPTVATIRSDGKKVKYLDVTPTTGTLGETAVFERTDTDTGDKISVRAVTVKADHAFLESLTKDKMTAVMEDELNGVTLDKKRMNFSKGSQTLNWGTLTGYNIDQNNQLFFNAVHYLAGLNSITIVKIRFSLENRQFKSYYEKISPSISYVGR